MTATDRRQALVKRAVLAAVLACAALAIAAPIATAAARFASPTGSSAAPCTQAQPCDILTAIEGAAENDDITIGPGTYGSPIPIGEGLEDEGKTLTIHGQAGQPRPLIVSQAEYVFELFGQGTSLRDVEIESAQAKYGFYVGTSTNVAVDHVVSHVSAPGAIACYPSGTLTDSVCWSSGPDGVAATILFIANASATLRNDTLIASGAGGTGVRALAGGGSGMTINLVNSIARGAGFDIRAVTDSEPTSRATVNAASSNYATVQIENGGGGSTTAVTPAGSGANQTGAPQFVDASKGNFRQRYDSTATIDRGENSPLNGTTDLEGNPRTMAGTYGCGPTPIPEITDIGAYEYMAPVPMCLPGIPGKPKISKARVSRKGKKATFTFSVDVAARFECRLQRLGKKGKKKAKKAVAFSNCKSPKTYRKLRPGRYRFEVRAVNAAGPGPAAAKRFKLKKPPPND